MPFDSTCLYSVVKNVSGVTKRFPFLPPHGVELANNETLSVWGDIREAVIRSTDRFGDRWADGLESALTGDLLEIRNTSAVILEDETLDDIKIITLDNNSMVLQDPCWEVSITL